MQSSTTPIEAPATKRFERELTQLIPHMRAFARSLCGNATQADDLAQEALAKAWQCRDSFQPGTNMKAWTFMILRNQFYSEKRRSWRSSHLDPKVAAETLYAVDDPSAALELDELRRALTMLPEEQREALILIGAAGLSYEEASAVMAIPTGTIKSRVSRARDRLALILAEGEVAADGAAPHAAMALLFLQVDAYCQRALAA
jgi:RNA polymerase sigma-70 factor (ECF subfamily)